MARTIIMVGGTGESANNKQFLDAFLAPYLRVDDKIIRLQYPAAIGPANPTKNFLDFRNSAAQSRVIGVNRLVDTIRRLDDVPVLVGYSLGAWIISEFLEDLNLRLHTNTDGSLLEVAGVVLVANPRRGHSSGTNRYGIAPGRIIRIHLNLSMSI